MSNSIGDLKNSGLQGNNWPWQYKVLLGLDKIASLLGTSTEYEAQLVTETCTGPPATSRILLEVRVWNTDTGTWGPTTYYLPGSSTPVTIGAGCTVAYVDSSAILAQILNVLQDIENGVPEALGQTDSNNSMPVVIANDQSAIPVTLDCDTSATKICFDDGTGPVNVNTTNPLPVNATVTIPNPLPVSQSTSPWVVSGSVGVTGEVEIINAVGSPIPVTVVAPVPVIQVNLDAVDDQVGVYGYVNGVSTTPVPLNVNALGAVAIQDDGGSITVDGAVTVSATALDIRPLDCTTDSIAICDGTPGGSNLVINNPGSPADGSINTVLVDLTTGSSAVINSDGTQNNAVYGYDYSTLQNEQITSTDISPTVQALDVNVAGFSRTPNILISSGDAPVTITVPVYSITFFNNGSVDVNISMDGGTTNALIPAGVTITMDAGGIQNTYPANTFIVGSTIAVGASMIVTYNS
jgi:hypothetical protein